MNRAKANGGPKKPRSARAYGPGRAMGERIVASRNVNGISQKELQRTSRLAKGHLSHIESGHKPAVRRSTIVSIVQGLRLLGVEVTPEYIMRGEGPSPRSLYAVGRAS